ncbi:MAG: AraC family transcriptional regulator [Rubrivivax sp.]
MSGVSPVVRSGTLFGYAELSDSLGLNTDALLARVSLSRTLLEDPDYLIPVDRVRFLLELTSQSPGADHFGLRLGARRRLANMGIVGMVVREQPTALLALQTLCRYLQLVTSSLQIAIDELEQVTVIREELTFAAGTPVRQSIELALAVMSSLLNELMDSGWKPQSVHFRHRAPRDVQPHRRAFRCPVHFNADFNGIVCAAAELQRQLPNRDEQLSRFVQASLEKTLAQAQGGPVAQVRRVIMGLMPLGHCSAPEVARHLRISSRSLHRLLAQHELNFSSLLSQVRRDMVTQQLRDSDRPITQIAQLLAFESSSAFGHWFQKAFGCSARDWRRQAQGPAAGPG